MIRIPEIFHALLITGSTFEIYFIQFLNMKVSHTRKFLKQICKEKIKTSIREIFNIFERKF